MKKYKVFLLSLALLGTAVFSTAMSPVAQAAPCEPGNQVLGLPTWYKYLEGRNEVEVTRTNPDGTKSTETIKLNKCTPVIEVAEDGLPIGLAVLEIFMTLGGMVAVVMIFWGSFNFVLTQGESDKAASARKTVINAAIGLAIIIVATRVVSFIANTITG